MDQQRCTHSWLGAFAGRLLQLRPGMHVGTAVHHAVQNIHRAGALDPLKAAEICAHLDFSVEPDATGTKSEAAHSMRYRAMFVPASSESLAAVQRGAR